MKTMKNAASIENVTSKGVDNVTADDVRAALVRYDVACGDGSSTAKVTKLHAEWKLALAAFNAAK